MDLEDLEERARGLLDPIVYDYYAGGADDELSVADNVAAWRRLRLRPRVLRDVSVVSTATQVLGTPVDVPVLVAPMAWQRMAHDGGEAAMARAAAAAGTVMTVPTLANVPLEQVAAAAPEAPRWFQVYVGKDRGWTEELVQRAAAHGYRALVMTVDLQVQGNRLRDERNRFALPVGLEAANAAPVLAATADGSGWTNYVRAELDATLVPDDIGWLESASGLPVLVKGVLRGDDASQCVAAGAAGVIVSNHGGRQLDTAVAPCDALADVVAAVADAGEVYVDGGIRRGTDVLKALALGARAVLLGRPLLWALAAEGPAGVTAVLDHFQRELARAMALCGAATVAELTPDLVAGPLSR